jgi:protein-S-isoprenylcysteine O-methyltransferase Ste14
LYLIYPRAIAWAAVPVPDWLRWLGVALGLVGVALMYWTMSNLGKNLTDTVVTRRDATLVTAGPYRFVRHPFYVTAALLMLAVSLLSANLLMAFFGMGTIALLAIRTPNEERKLIERFGDSYRDYMARTGRFMPRLSR